MASFTAVGQTLELAVPYKRSVITIAVSGTYDQIIKFQEEVGSPGTGAWQTYFTFNTENGTEAEVYVTKKDKVNVRLVLDTDDGGDATVTLTDNTVTEFRAIDIATPDGRKLMTFNEDHVLVPGQFVAHGYDIVTITASTDVLTPAEHAGRIVTLDKSGGIDLTLPEATGSGDTYKFFILTTTTDAYTWTAEGGGKLFGQMVGTDANVEFTWNAVGGTDTTLTLGGSNQETGGTKGDFVTFVDIGADIWYVVGTLEHGTGTEATPFGT